MKLKRAVTAAAVAVAALVIAGCSSDTGKTKNPGSQSSGDTAAAAVKFAQTYQETVNDQDWQRACQMRTERYRHGTVQQCVTDNTETETASPSPSPSESTVPPLRRADGSVVQPKRTPTASGPDRAETGAVTASGPVSVAAIGEHPAGTGVLVEYKVVWPDSTTTSRRALRVVKDGDQWLVDQAEDIAASDDAHGNPVRDALMRG
jgi:outer membrane murein-binding lipoprotein Lpp